MIFLTCLVFFCFKGTTGSTQTDLVQIAMLTRDLMVMESTDFTINCTTDGLATRLMIEPMEFIFTQQETSDSTPGNRLLLSQNNDLKTGIDSAKYEVSFSAQSDFSFYLVVKASSLKDTGVYTCARGGQNASTFVEVRSKQDIICTCADGYIRYGNACFRFYNQHLSWPEAAYMCETFHSDLVHIESNAEYEFIKGYAKETQGGYSGNGFWLGATSAILPGHWHWKDDFSEVDFDEMSQLQSDAANQDCLSLSSDFSLRGATCDNGMDFICKTKVSKCI